MAKRERAKDPEPSKPSMEWLLTFSDVLTLLITFFVLQISMSSMDAKKLQQTFGFFVAALANLEGGGASASIGLERPEVQGKIRPIPFLNTVLKPKTLKNEELIKQRLRMLVRASRELADRLIAARSPRAGARGVKPLRLEVVRLLREEPLQVVQRRGELMLRMHVRLFFDPASVNVRMDANTVVRELRQLVYRKGTQLERIEVPVAERGDTAHTYSPWDLAAWRASALVRQVRGTAFVAAGVVSADNAYVGVVLKATPFPLGPSFEQAPNGQNSLKNEKDNG